MGLFGKDESPELKATKKKIDNYLGKIKCEGEPIDIISAFTPKTYLWAEARKRMIDEAYSGMLNENQVEDRYCELVAEITNTPKEKVFERRSKLRGHDISPNDYPSNKSTTEEAEEINESSKIYVMDGNTLETGKNILGKEKEEYVRCKCILSDDMLSIEKRSTFTAKPKGVDKIYYKNITNIDFIPGKISTIRIETQSGENLIQHFNQNIIKGFYNGLKEYVDNK